MNKKTFISELEKKLSILVENERKDIINEYKDIIDEKVKHGATEEEAVASFGNIDELVKEILSAYKINYNYRSTQDSVKNIVDDCGNLIEKGARWLSDVTRGIVDDIKKKDKNFTLENAFEIILKFFIVLVILLIARIPFAIIGGMLEGIVGMGIAPFDWITKVAIHVVMWVIYIAFCATVCVVFFKKYFNNSTTTTEVKKETKPEPKKKKEKNEVKTEELKPEEDKKQNISESTKNETKQVIEVKKNDDALGIILKIFVYIMFLIPLFFINLGLVVGIAAIVYLMAKGLILWEVLLILLGLLTIFSSIGDNIKRLLYDRRVFFFPFFIGFIILIVGSLLTVDYATKLEYYNYLPTNNFTIKKETLEVDLDKELVIDNSYKYEIVIDDTITEDKARIEMDYYNQVIELERKIRNRDDYNLLDLDTDIMRPFYVLNNIIIDNLNDYKLYRYSDFYRTTIKVYVNTKNINKIS